MMFLTGDLKLNLISWNIIYYRPEIVFVKTNLGAERFKKMIVS
jgi:hypothetical protein